jgi:DNA glycosylase AlkZ-like
VSPQALAARQRAQGLGAVRARDAHGAVRQALAIQAQDTRSSRLGIRARSEGLTSEDVVRACSQERSVVRTWAMRGTLHVLCAEDVRWILSLVGPVVEARSAPRRAQLGITPELGERILAAIPGILADSGPLVRAELMEALIARGLPIDTSDQAPAHIVVLAAVRGIVCRGPDRPDEEPTYVRLDDWVPPSGPPIERDAALAELARRYVRAYGPADVRDLAYWSGLPAADARRAFALAPPPGPPADADAEPPPPRLLPAFDGYLLGHRDRSAILDPEHAPRLLSGSWMLPSMVVGGRIAGTWRRTRERGAVALVLSPFAGRLPRGAARALRAEAADVGRFLGAPARVTVAAA